MTEEWPDSPKPETWGAFVKYAREFGVTVEQLPEVTYPDGRVGPIPFLRRVTDGEVLTYPMPMDCTQDRPMRYRRVLEVCERLRLKIPPWCVTI